jgi:hypothetical protein
MGNRGNLQICGPLMAGKRPWTKSEIAELLSCENRAIWRAVQPIQLSETKVILEKAFCKLSQFFKC